VETLAELPFIGDQVVCFKPRPPARGRGQRGRQSYLAWMLGNEDGFYREFMSGDPENLSQKKIGNLRQEIFTNAIAKMPKGLPFIPEIIEKLVYDRKFDRGFERAFEHAVYLITIEQLELRTAPQNFNFIFVDPADDNTYDALYSWLPYLLFFLAHTILELFDRMRKHGQGDENRLRRKEPVCLYAHRRRSGGHAGGNKYDAFGRFAVLVMLPIAATQAAICASTDPPVRRFGGPPRRRPHRPQTRLRLGG
jgi:hypothetical protein